jgi:hypothetical protein
MDGMTTETNGRSASIGNLAKALALAQGAMSAAAKDRNNPFFKSRYADLSSVWEACRPQLAKQGLSVIQLIHAPGKVEGGLYETRAVVETVLAHESGEWISSTMSLPVLGPDLKGGGRGEVNPQSFGSAITYARRYALAAIVGVYQDDDDGNSASRHVDEPEVSAMPESALADHLAAIEASAALEDLRRVYLLGVRAAGSDQAAVAKIVAAKDARKTALEAKAKQPEPVAS